MHYAAGLLLLAAPLYQVRFDLLGLPLNLLLLLQGAFLFTVAVYASRDWGGVRAALGRIPWPIWACASLFLLSSLIALLPGVLDEESLGQWLVIYALPPFCGIGAYLSLIWAGTKRPPTGQFIAAGYLIVAAAGALALGQYFTLWSLPPDWWGNANEPKRAVAFFAHPNGYALFATPLLAFLLPDAARAAYLRKRFLPSCAWLLGAVGLGLSLSRGGWLGIGLAAAAFAAMSLPRRYYAPVTLGAIGLIGLLMLVPVVRYRVTLPFAGEKSAVARFSLWSTASDMIRDNPVLGKGITGFSRHWDVYNTDPNLQHYNYPHNIILNFWVEGGAVLMLSFLLLSLALFLWSARHLRSVYALGLLLSFLAIFAHGLVDIPYQKNDLALLYWLLAGIALGSVYQRDVNAAQAEK